MVVSNEIEDGCIKLIAPHKSLCLYITDSLNYSEDNRKSAKIDNVDGERHFPTSRIGCGIDEIMSLSWKYVLVAVCGGAALRQAHVNCHELISSEDNACPVN
jgi:hypothetical protein